MLSRRLAVVALVALVALAVSCGAGAPAPTTANQAQAKRQLVLDTGHAAPPPLAAPATRRALVIGNGAYAAPHDLVNPPHDAAAMEHALQALGFASVDREVDLDRDGLPNAVNRFVAALAPGDDAVVFYAGHGFEISGANYLLPVDFKATNEADARGDAYGLDRLLDRLESRRPADGNGGANVIILDACRNNPFEGPWDHGKVHGFQPLPGARAGTSIWFSTRTTAEDGDGAPDSPFTTALVGALAEHAADPLLFFDVKERVMAATQTRQEPFHYEALEEPFLFAPAAAAPSTSAPPASAASMPAGPRSRALFVGVSHYADPAYASLHFDTHGDVQAMTRALTALGYGDVARLEDEHASLANVRAALDALASSSHPGDRVAVHFSGGAYGLDDGSSEADGRDEALFTYDMRPRGAATGKMAPIDPASVLLDDELAKRLVALRTKVGPAGHVLVVLDAYRLFEGGVEEIDPSPSPDAAALTLIQPAHDIAAEGHPSDDNPAGGLITRAFFVAATNAEPRESFRTLGREMQRAFTGTPAGAFRIEGDEDVAVGTGAPTPGGTFVETEPRLTYGPLSVYLRGGRLQGLFPGTVVELYAPSRFPPRAARLARGTVVQTGWLRSRVELESHADVAGAWAMPVVRAMPPVAVRVTLDASVKTRQAEMESRMAAIGGARGGGHDVLALEVVEQTSYGFVKDAASGAVVAGPIELADPRYVEWMSGAVWQLAYERYLASVDVGESVHSEAGIDLATQPEPSCTGQALQLWTTALDPRDHRLPAARRSLELEVGRPPPAAAIWLGDDGSAAPLDGAESFAGLTQVCVTEPGVVRVFADVPEDDLILRERVSPRKRLDPDVGAVAAREEEVPLGPAPSLPTTKGSLASASTRVTFAPPPARSR